MTRVLLSGIAGFAGSHLADKLLLDSTISVVGIHHPAHALQHVIENPRFVIHYLDILNPDDLGHLIQEVSPDVIYHLAGMAHVHESWTNRRATIETNFLGTFHLLESCRNLAKFPKVLLIGSGECYGIVPQAEQPISEERPMVPASPYAVSKIAQEILGVQYAKAEKFPVYISRPFNHTGPRQKETFVCSAFAMQIAMAELGMSEPEIKVGNLTARRDFSDVRDVVAGYISIVKDGRPGEPYNICSGTAVSIQQILDILLSHASRKFRVVVDQERFRPVDMPILLGNAEKLKTETHWQPKYLINQTLLDLLNYWRKKLK
ncbi:GDP-mannose 4,6-dehydratase [bacterium]|nr:GDP-mannose 4,6-dehydratase [bacterium]MCI0606450.1 GDP-mannose 4,6-dehydratase [bacterium]